MTWAGANTTFPPLFSTTTSTQWPGSAWPCPARRGLLIPVRLTGGEVGSKSELAPVKGSQISDCDTSSSAHDNTKIKNIYLTLLFTHNFL